MTAPATPAAPAIVLHAGAGSVSRELREHGDECRAALAEALTAAQDLLERGAGAIDAVLAAVSVMEDFPRFNSGRGAALCADGSAELSAALMRGTDRAAGGIAGVHHCRNPIMAAHLVLQSDQVLMIGADADALAAQLGLPQEPNAYFIIERQRAELARGGDADRGTVGAVCLDAHGGLAAGTSTGGVRGQPPGRVGDSPLIGAGTWADDRVAVSCTGDGEAFIRAGAARALAALVAHGVAVDEAAVLTLADVIALEGNGGLIALDASGRPAIRFGTAAMPHAVWRAGHQPTIWI